jgi:hypothetical protein
MGIRLDWEVEAGAGTSHVAEEDPNARRQRRTARTRFILILLGITLLVGVVISVITWRLNEANAYIESLLMDTFEAEFSALRIDNWEAFNQLQRSADPNWEVTQRAKFDQIQSLKLTGQIQLSGVARAIDIDGTRARVLASWMQDGIIVAEPWFYWRYPDGWRQVPPDYTFWGEQRELNGRDVTVIYNSVDATVADNLGLAVEGWVASACGPILQCGDLPHLTLNIIADPDLTVAWDPDQPWQLNLPSPLTGLTSFDHPITDTLRRAVANAIAGRLVIVSVESTLSFDASTDAGYLIQASQRWLAAKFVDETPVNGVIASLVSQRGTQAIGAVLRPLLPTSTLGDVLSASDASSLLSALDWRDFLGWRLTLEAILSTRGESDAAARLYVEEMRPRAYERSALAVDPGVIEVLSISQVTAPDGSPAMIASVVFDALGARREEAVYFFWRDNTWLRAS